MASSAAPPAPPSMIKVICVDSQVPGNRYELEVHFPTPFINKFSNVTDVVLCMGLPTLPCVDFDGIKYFGTVDLGTGYGMGGVSTTMLGGLPLHAPSHPALTPLRRLDFESLVTPASSGEKEKDMSDKMTELVELLYRRRGFFQDFIGSKSRADGGTVDYPPKATEALQWLKEYIFTMETTILDFCHAGRQSARCIQVHLRQGSGANSELCHMPEFSRSDPADFAKNLSMFLWGKADVLTGPQIATLQAMMTGVFVPGGDGNISKVIVDTTQLNQYTELLDMGQITGESIKRQMTLKVASGQLDPTLHLKLTSQGLLPTAPTKGVCVLLTKSDNT